MPRSRCGWVWAGKTDGLKQMNMTMECQGNASWKIALWRRAGQRRLQGRAAGSNRARSGRCESQNGVVVYEPILARAVLQARHLAHGLCVLEKSAVRRFVGVAT